MEVKVHCYLATKPEVEGFRDLPEVQSLRVQSFVAKALVYQSCIAMLALLLTIYAHIISCAQYR